MPLYAEANAVIAPISSGSKGALLHSLTMPLVLLRPSLGWGGEAMYEPTAAVAARNKVSRVQVQQLLADV
jgi:hypothetical protein